MTGYYQSRSGEETEEQRAEKAMTLAANGVDIDPETMKPVVPEAGEGEEQVMEEGKEVAAAGEPVNSSEVAVGEVKPDEDALLSGNADGSQMDAEFETPPPEAASKSEANGEAMPVRRAGLKHRRMGAAPPKDGKEKRRKVLATDQQQKLTTGAFSAAVDNNFEQKKPKKKSSWKAGAMLPVSRLGGF